MGPPTQEPSVEIEIMYDILLRGLILRLLFFDATTDAMTVLFVSKHCSYANRWEGGHSSKGFDWMKIASGVYPAQQLSLRIKTRAVRPKNSRKWSKISSR